MTDLRTWAGAVVAGIWLIAWPAFAQQAPEPIEGAEREAIEGIIADYILQNPEIIYRALQILQERQQAAQAEQARLALDAHRDALERDPNSPVGGNPEGDVTVVEFFDYRCPYCKRVAPDVERLIDRDPGVRVVYKEWPILGSESVFAARAALAAREQDRYLDFHDRVMSLEEVTEASVMGVADDLGLDVEQLRDDMAAPEVDAHIRQTAQLAQALGISGTPAFVIGDQVVPGAAGYEALSGSVAAARE
ncbi:MAG TPA: DsbA family protein [Geminicoccaceae bacterium]